MGEVKIIQPTQSAERDEELRMAQRTLEYMERGRVLIDRVAEGVSRCFCLVRKWMKKRR
jgi:uncharacterized protein YyaL (SSP411 family)